MAATTCRMIDRSIAMLGPRLRSTFLQPRRLINTVASNVRNYFPIDAICYLLQGTWLSILGQAHVKLLPAILRTPGPIFHTNTSHHWPDRKVYSSVSARKSNIDDSNPKCECATPKSVVDGIHFDADKTANINSHPRILITKLAIRAPHLSPPILNRTLPRLLQAN